MTQPPHPAGPEMQDHWRARVIQKHAVPRDSHREKSARDARDLPKQIREEIEKFFVATDELEDKELEFLGWKGPKTEEKLVDQAATQFSKSNLAK